MPKKIKLEAIVLLDIVDEQFMNVKGKEAKTIVHKLAKMLTEDGVWTLKHISYEDACALHNLVVTYVESGEHPKYDSKSDKACRV